MVPKSSQHGLQNHIQTAPKSKLTAAAEEIGKIMRRIFPSQAKRLRIYRIPREAPRAAARFFRMFGMSCVRALLRRAAGLHHGWPASRLARAAGKTVSQLACVTAGLRHGWLGLCEKASTTDGLRYGWLRLPEKTVSQRLVLVLWCVVVLSGTGNKSRASRGNQNRNQNRHLFLKAHQRRGSGTRTGTRTGTVVLVLVLVPLCLPKVAGKANRNWNQH